jgi:hypothetical protein
MRVPIGLNGVITSLLSITLIVFFMEKCMPILYVQFDDGFSTCIAYQSPQLLRKHIGNILFPYIPASITKISFTGGYVYDKT